MVFLDDFFESEEPLYYWYQECQSLSTPCNSLGLSAETPVIFLWGRTSTTTSLCPMKSGIVEAWTGVMRLNPMLDTASRIHSANGGVMPFHALGDSPNGNLELEPALFVAIPDAKKCCYDPQRKNAAALRFIEWHQPYAIDVPSLPEQEILLSPCLDVANQLPSSDSNLLTASPDSCFPEDIYIELSSQSASF